jgi:hypothetical protein
VPPNLLRVSRAWRGTGVAGLGDLPGRRRRRRALGRSGLASASSNWHSSLGATFAVSVSGVAAGLRPGSSPSGSRRHFVGRVPDDERRILAVVATGPNARRGFPRWCERNRVGGREVAGAGTGRYSHASRALRGPLRQGPWSRVSELVPGLSMRIAERDGLVDADSVNPGASHRRPP